MSSPTNRSFGGGRLNTGLIKLLLRFVAIVITAPALGWMMGRAWVKGNLLYDGAASILTAILGSLTYSQSLQIFASAILGLYFGLLLLFILDIKKRIQGALLLLGTTIALGVLTTQGVLLPNLNPGYLPNVAVFLLTFASAIVIEIDKLTALSIKESKSKGDTFEDDSRTNRRSYGEEPNAIVALLTNPRLDDRSIPEFDTAAKALFVLISGGVVLSLAQVAIAGVLSPIDPVVSVIAIVLLYQFIQYEVNANFALIGPSNSGKSMVMLGMVLTLLDYDGVHPESSNYLKESIDNADSGNHDGNWPIPNTKGLEESSFQTVAGTYFPKRMRLVAYDYPGEWLKDFPEKVHQLSGSRFSWLPFVGGTDRKPTARADGGQKPNDEQKAMVARTIVDSDILMVVIDCERFVDSGKSEETQSLGTEYYKDILEASNIEDAIITVTKADVLFHDDGQPVQSPEEAGGFRAFKKQVEETVGNRHVIQDLKRTVGEQELHPVYFETIEKDGEYVPVREEDTNNMIPVGYDHLLDTISEKA